MFNTQRLQLRKIIIHHFHSCLSNLYKVDCSPYSALQRFVILSESLYTLPLTWDRKSWQPTLAKRQALYGFIIASFISFVAASLIISSGIWEIVAFAKDPTLSIMTHILTVFYMCGQSICISLIHCWWVYAEDLRFILVGSWSLSGQKGMEFLKLLVFVSPVTLALAITGMARVTGK